MNSTIIILINNLGTFILSVGLALMIHVINATIAVGTQCKNYDSKILFRVYGDETYHRVAKPNELCRYMMVHNIIIPVAISLSCVLIGCLFQILLKWYNALYRLVNIVVGLISSIFLGFLLIPLINCLVINDPFYAWMGIYDITIYTRYNTCYFDTPFAYVGIVVYPLTIIAFIAIIITDLVIKKMRDV